MSADPITDVLHDLKLERTYFCCSELRSPWGVAFPARTVSAFHVVIAGHCVLETPSTQVMLGPGGFALLPHGTEHLLLEVAGAAATPAAQLVKESVSNNVGRIVHGGTGPSSHLLCGIVKCAGPFLDQLRSSLPEVLALEPSLGSTNLEGLSRAMLAEATASRPGTLTILQRLVEVLVIEALRHWIESQGHQAGWIRALCDPQIGQALALLHREPSHPWTVGSLAATVHMSRPVFAERFRRLVGMPPMKYLAVCRFRIAREALLREGTTIGEVAARLGYESEAAFARAFKRTMGVTPGALRREATARRRRLAPRGGSVVMAG